MPSHVAETIPVLSTEIAWTLRRDGLDDVLGRLGKVLADSILKALRESGVRLACDPSCHRREPEPVPDPAHLREVGDGSARASGKGHGESDAIRDLINVHTLAAMLGVSERQIWKLVSSGRLPVPVRLARSVRWRTEEIRCWIDAGCPSPERWRAARR